jgi:hypothetical protein
MAGSGRFRFDQRMQLGDDTRKRGKPHAVRLRGFVSVRYSPLDLDQQRSMLELVAGAGSNLYLLPEQVKMVAGTGSHHNLLFETAA